VTRLVALKAAVELPAGPTWDRASGKIATKTTINPATIDIVVIRRIFYVKVWFDGCAPVSTS